MPRAVDGRLQITSFAAEPRVVTPTGIAVDGRGRVLVIESHTHFRPAGYAGPAADRILRLEDNDGDGAADTVATFFEGTKHTMSLAVYPLEDGSESALSVYVATRNEVFRLRDRNGDGVADERTPLVRLETAGDYPHNGLSGFAFDFSGNVYFGLGENLGERYELVGSDGKWLGGGGEGGNLYRCRADGSELTPWATGFWNPFHLCFDAFGRLFAVDNDPDSRPPCRLLHIVHGGDYGYRFRNGRKGLHPFTSWNGELPGTLPMAAGTGEAPSGIVAYESDGLPEDYRGTLLVTSWGDHRLEQYQLKRHGASFHAVAEPVVVGDENFRPVGIAVGPEGSLYVSDWVDRSYELHGKGRVWKIGGRARAAQESDKREPMASPRREVREAAARRLSRSERGIERLQELVRGSEDARIRATALVALAALGKADGTGATADRSEDVRAIAVRLLPEDTSAFGKIAQEDSSPLVRAEALRRLNGRDGQRLLRKTLSDADPFVQLAARQGLRRTSGAEDWISWLHAADPSDRLEYALLLRDSPHPQAQELIPALLKDVDPAVRFAAVQWVAEHDLKRYRDQLSQVLMLGSPPRSLFEAYLVAVARLDGLPTKDIDELGADDHIAPFVTNTKIPRTLRRLALRMLRPDHASLTLEKLRELLGEDDVLLQQEVVRTLRESPHVDAGSLLAEIAGDDRRPASVRAEAVVGLRAELSAQRDLLMKLASCGEPILEEESLRTLQGSSLTATERSRISSVQRSKAMGELVQRVLQPQEAGLPSSGRASLRVLVGDGDPAAGERIFLHPKGPGCFRCHQVVGRGAAIGPDLSHVGGAFPRARLIESILYPSKEIAPQFVAWSVEMSDGTSFTGMLVTESQDGRQTYADANGQKIVVFVRDIAERHPLRTSIMPDGIERALTQQELRDLLAFLERKP